MYGQVEEHNRNNGLFDLWRPILLRISYNKCRDIFFFILLYFYLKYIEFSLSFFLLILFFLAI